MRLTESQLRSVIRKLLTEWTPALKADAEWADLTDGSGPISGLLSGKSVAQAIKEAGKKRKKRKKSNHDPNYGAPEGSKRDKQLDATKADLKSGDPKRVARAYRRRKRMEDKARSEPGYKNKPRKDTKKESVQMSETALRKVIRSVLEEELNKKTKATLKKKAEKRGLTPGSVEAEFKKGLAAFATSGSRKGMTAHQWAHARVNSATPGKEWAVVKKSKAKKKKKSKKS